MSFFTFKEIQTKNELEHDVQRSNRRSCLSPSTLLPPNPQRINSEASAPSWVAGGFAINARPSDISCGHAFLIQNKTFFRETINPPEWNICFEGCQAHFTFPIGFRFYNWHLISFKVKIFHIFHKNFGGCDISIFLVNFNVTFEFSRMIEDFRAIVTFESSIMNCLLMGFKITWSVERFWTLLAFKFSSIGILLHFSDFRRGRRRMHFVITLIDNLINFHVTWIMFLGRRCQCRRFAFFGLH